jgi:dienelactone hydrolase
MAACCISGSAFSGTPSGAEQALGGIACYVARPPGDAAADCGGGKVLLFLADVFGWRFVNPRLLADRYAAALGATVVVPDLHAGDSLAVDALDFMIKPAATRARRLWNLLVGCVRVPLFLAWLARHTTRPTLPRLAAVAAALRAPRADGGLAATRVAALGYCWGGQYAVLMGGGVPAQADAVVACHTSNTSTAQNGAISVPSLFICAEHDHVFPAAARRAGEAALAARPAGAPPATFTVYPGTTHGFASRGDEVNATERAALDAAFAQTAAFLKEHL